MNIAKTYNRLSAIARGAVGDPNIPVFFQSPGDRKLKNTAHVVIALLEITPDTIREDAGMWSVTYSAPSESAFLLHADAFLEAFTGTPDAIRTAVDVGVIQQEEADPIKAWEITVEVRA